MHAHTTPHQPQSAPALLPRPSDVGARLLRSAHARPQSHTLLSRQPPTRHPPPIIYITRIIRHFYIPPPHLLHQR
jgi:hypothetical protein